MTGATPKRSKGTHKHHKTDTYKDRGQWFLSRSTFPLRDAAPEALERFWENIANYELIPGVEWTEAGPRNFPGRVTSLVIHPDNPQKLYAGAATGGVWTSDDGGDNWRSCWPRLMTQNIGALALAPWDSNLIICATGEANLSGEGYPGSGVFKSRNGGFTWTPAAMDTALRSPSSRAVMPRRIGTIAFGYPFVLGGEPKVALGAVSETETMPAALYLNHPDTGLQPVTFWGDRNYNCHAVVFHPVFHDRIYAAIAPRGTLNGIWRSDDFGKSWHRLGRGLPPGEDCGRISLAMAPSKPDVLYALISDNSKGHGVLGVYRTDDGGERWHEISGNLFEKERQLSYNNCLAVHPTNPDFVVCGGADLHLSTNGGRSWTQITTGARGQPGPQGLPPNFVHNDHHAIVITSEGVIYSGNDGGVARSNDSGSTWTALSEGMATAMFYAADVAQSDSRVFGGGTQDNGTLITGIPAAKGQHRVAEGHFVRVLGSDGGWLRFDPTDADHVFGSTMDFDLFRHRQGEPWAEGDWLAPWKVVSIPDDLLQDRGEKSLRSLFVIEMGPSTRKGSERVYVGTSRLYCSADDGHTWTGISRVFDGSAISAIACSSMDPDVLMVGTSKGAIFRTRDGGETWSSDLAGPAIPKRLITRMAFHPEESKTVVITVGSSGTPGVSLTAIDRPGASPKRQQTSGARPYGHVFRSMDEGDTWHELDNGQLPDVVYNALAFETHRPYRIFVGGDAGVWVTTIHDHKHPWDCGWASYAGNMPNVVISDLNFHHKDRILTAATYGRGIWRHKAVEPLPPMVPILDGANVDAGPLAVGWALDPSREAPVGLDGLLLMAVNKDESEAYPEWKPVNDAIGYAVDVYFAEDGGHGRSMEIGTTETQAHFVFYGERPTSWRVWALFEGSVRSRGSAKYTFTL